MNPNNTPDPMMVSTVSQPPLMQPNVAMPPQQPIVMNNPTPVDNNGWQQFFRQVSWVEVGFLILSTAAFLFLIRYYRYRLYADKNSSKKMQMEVDDLTAKVSGIETKLKQSAKKQTSFR